jgi:predicted DNA-binding transcriptional regulator AlpA
MSELHQATLFDDPFPNRPYWVTVRDLLPVLEISRGTLFKWLRLGKIPQPNRISSRMSRWSKAVAVDMVRNGPWPDGTFPIPPKQDLELRTEVEREDLGEVKHVAEREDLGEVKHVAEDCGGIGKRRKRSAG